MRNLYYPDFGNQYNVFWRGGRIVGENPLSFITPRGNDYTQDDKIQIISRYIQEICRLNKPPGIVDSVVTRFNEFYKFDKDIFVLVKKGVPHPKGE